MNKCVALFTGGKESAFSILKARELGYEVEELIFPRETRVLRTQSKFASSKSGC